MLVYQGGLSPRYIADEAEMYEISILAQGLYLKSKENWEQTRMISFITAQVNSSKKLKPNDILSFPWDDKMKDETKVSNEDIERLSKKAKEMEKLLKSK